MLSLQSPYYELHRVPVAGGDIHCVVGGKADGSPLLLLHGHPQTHVIWHLVAPELGKTYRIIAADLRGYGDSLKPDGLADHSNYSKRTMAADQVAVMRALGYEHFRVVAHDRGARVAHRMALDHPQAVEKLVVLDIAPTLSMYEGTTMEFARAYWHWFFLIQPQPLPETVLGQDPTFYLRQVMNRGQSGIGKFHPEAFAEYLRCIQLPNAIHGTCEDYRAAATIDLEHDRADRAAGKKVTCPLLVLWGAEGVIERCFKPLTVWENYATNVRGKALPCGHYIPEEAPDALLSELRAFL
jgi:haloacetate dehalogenase